MIKKRSPFFVLLLMAIVIGGCSLPRTNQNNNPIGASPILNTTVDETVSSEELTQIYANSVKSVVTVFNFDQLYKGVSSGSGVVVSEDENYAYIFTNAHVTSGGINFEVAFYNNERVKAYLATSTSFDSSEDVAILKVEKSQNYIVTSLGDSSILKVGQQILAIGSPLGFNYSNTLTTGIISGLDVKVESDNDRDGNKTTMYMIQVDAALNPGNSGGALFTLTGQLVGINTLKIIITDSGDDVESFNFSIAINHFKHVADILLETGSYSRPKLGIIVRDITSMNLEERNLANIQVSNGLYIEEVVLGGPSKFILFAERVIVEINDICVHTMNDFSVELFKFNPGDTIQISTVNKNGTNKDTHTIELGG